MSGEIVRARAILTSQPIVLPLAAYEVRHPHAAEALTLTGPTAASLAQLDQLAAGARAILRVGVGTYVVLR